MPEDPVVTLEGVSMVYPSGTRALDGVSLEMRPGRFGLLGQNGAGKTTCLSILALALRQTAGRVALFGETLGGAGLRRLRSRIGFLDQAFVPPGDLTGFEYLVYCGATRLPGWTRRRIEQRATELLRITDLSSAADSRAGNYSGGMRRRLGLCQALVHEPPLLILDEPTAGLDPEQQIAFRSLVARLPYTRLIVLSSHVVEDIEQTCHHLAVLDRGRLAFVGTTEGLLALGRGRDPGCGDLEAAYAALVREP